VRTTFPAIFSSLPAIHPLAPSSAAYHRAVAAISALSSAAQSARPTEFFVEACAPFLFRLLLFLLLKSPLFLPHDIHHEAARYFTSVTRRFPDTKATPTPVIDGDTNPKLQRRRCCCRVSACKCTSAAERSAAKINNDVAAKGDRCDLYVHCVNAG
jgi:hypothetical protein